MKRIASLLVVVLLGWTLDSLGYGGGQGGGSSCPEPKFAEFDPPSGVEVSPGSKFSFLAWSVLPETLEVTVKGQPVAVEITPKGANYLVSGTLPPELKDTFARINLSGYGPGRCQGTSGWLVKIRAQ